MSEFEFFGQMSWDDQVAHQPTLAFNRINDAISSEFFTLMVQAYSFAFRQFRSHPFLPDLQTMGSHSQMASSTGEPSAKLFSVKSLNPGAISYRLRLSGLS